MIATIVRSYLLNYFANSHSAFLWVSASDLGLNGPDLEYKIQQQQSINHPKLLVYKTFRDRSQTEKTATEIV